LPKRLRIDISVGGIEMMVIPSFKVWFIVILLIFIVGMVACYDAAESEQFIKDSKYTIEKNGGTLLITDNYTIADGFVVVKDYSYWHIGCYGEVEHKTLKISTSGIIISER
jgi:uncharacterized membrane protein